MLVQTNLRVHPTAAARNIYYEAAAPITANNVQDAIEQAAASGGASITPTNIAIGQSPYTVLAADRYIRVDTSGGNVTINMMPSAARNGLDVEIKKVTADANSASAVRNGGEDIDGIVSYPIDSPLLAVRFMPRANGYDVV